jgi:hypothetical protein
MGETKVELQTVSAPSGSQTTDNLGLGPIRLLAAEIGLASGGPVKVSIGFVVRGVYTVLETGYLRAPSENIFEGVRWYAGEGLDLPEGSEVRTTVRNDTGATVETNTSWVFE